MECNNKIRGVERRVVTKDVDDIDTDEHLTNYNSQDYFFNCLLCNQSGKQVSINSQAIAEIVIDDDLNRWWTQGHIIIHDNYNTFQRAPDIVRGQPGVEDSEYKFRGDGRDLLTLDVYPDFTKLVDGGDGTSGIKKDYWNMWLLHYDLVVYDVEDMPSTKGKNKMLKLYFWDEIYQKARDKNVEWSTATSVENEAEGQVYMMNNEDRAIQTGAALIGLLKENGFDQHLDKAYQPNKVTYNEEPKEFDPEMPHNVPIAPIDAGHENNTIFYTSPTQSRLVDDIKFITDRHVSKKDNDLCVFRQERSPETEGTPKKFSLRSYGDIFDLAGKETPGPWQSEHFFFREDGEPADLRERPFKSPYTSAPTTYNDFKFTGHNDIMSFRFVDWAGIDNAQAVIHRPQFSFSGGSKQFSYDVADHTPAIAKAAMKTRMVDKLHTETGGSVMMTMNNAKSKAWNVTPEFSTRGSLEGRHADGLNKILLAGIGLNASLTFNVKGVTCRQPGRFIGVDRIQAATDSDFDNRLLGQWFVTKVVHRFAGQLYENTLVSVKIHNVGEKIGISEDVD